MKVIFPTKNEIVFDVVTFNKAQIFAVIIDEAIYRIVRSSGGLILVNDNATTPPKEYNSIQDVFLEAGNGYIFNTIEEYQKFYAAQMAAMHMVVIIHEGMEAYVDFYPWDNQYVYFARIDEVKPDGKFAKIAWEGNRCDNGEDAGVELIDHLLGIGMPMHEILGQISGQVSIF